MRQRAWLFLIILVFLMFFVSACTEVKQITESEIIPFKTVKKDDPTSLEGKTKVIRKGDAGIKTIVYEDIYKWGNKVERKKIKTETVFKPKPKIVKVGTKKAVKLEIKTPTSTFEIIMTSASRYPSGYSLGRLRIRGDAVVLKGTIENTGAKPAKTGMSTDLALIHPSLRNGLTFLPITPVILLAPGKTTEVVWAGALVDRADRKTAINSMEQINLTARAYVGPKNAINGEIKSLAELPLL